MRTRRLPAIALLAATGLLVTGCTSEALPVISEDDASTTDVVLAVRLSPQLSGINAGARDGYVLLVDGDGNARALEVGAMDAGQLAWADDGLFFSGPTDEYLLTADGLVSRPRGSEEAYETSRFLTPDGEGFISLYNVGFAEGHYLERVTTGDTSAMSSWDVTGMFDAVSQCGELVVGVTNITETNATVNTPAFHTDALVQLYPEPPGETAAILATWPVSDGSFASSTTDTPCVDGAVYTLAFQYDEPEAGGIGWPVLRVWDTRSGDHAVLPLLSEDGTAIDVEVDDVLARPGVIAGGRYVWVTRAGHALSTDLLTGVTTEAFQIALSSPRMNGSQFVFTESSVFVLDVSDDSGAPLDLSRYDLATGERTRLLSVPGTGSVHDGLGMVIRDMALDPEWAKANG